MIRIVPIGMRGLGTDRSAVIGPSSLLFQQQVLPATPSITPAKSFPIWGYAAIGGGVLVVLVGGFALLLRGKGGTRGMGDWSIDRIRSCNTSKGHHWFDRDTMRFFRSRIGRTVYEGPGGVYFVSSEQFVGSSHTGPRQFSVRRFDPSDCSVDTVADFQKFNNGREASAVAKRLARGGA